MTHSNKLTEPTTLRRVVSSAGESRLAAGSKASGRTALRNIWPGAGPAWYWLAAFAD